MAGWFKKLLPLPTNGHSRAPVTDEAAEALKRVLHEKADAWERLIEQATPTNLQQKPVGHDA